MLVYLFTFTISILFTALYVNEKNLYAKRKKRRANLLKSNAFGTQKTESVSSSTLFTMRVSMVVLTLLAVLPVWFITAFRYDVGTDYLFTYTRRFYTIQNGEEKFTEPLFEWFYELLIWMKADVVWVFIITGLVINLGVYVFCFKYSDNPVLSIVLYFVTTIFFSTLNNVRQFIAIIISMFGMYQKKHLKAFLIFLVASLVHLSALVYFFIYIIIRLANYKLTRKKFIIISLCTFVLVPVLSRLFVFIISVTKYKYFLENYVDGNYSLMEIIINSVIYIMTLVYFDDEKHADDAEYKGLALIQTFTLALCIMGVSLKMMELSGRLIRLCQIFQIVLIPKILKREKNALIRMGETATIISMFTVYLVYTIILKGTFEVLPFRFIF